MLSTIRINRVSAIDFEAPPATRPAGLILSSLHDRQHQGVPSVFITLQGESVEPTITVRLTHITPSSFQVALQEEGERQPGAGATLTWLAIYSPTGQGNVQIEGEKHDYQLSHANLINTGWTAVGDNDFRLVDEPGGEAVQISETVALLTINGQSFGQIQSLNHCDRVVSLASLYDSRTPGQSGYTSCTPIRSTPPP